MNILYIQKDQDRRLSVIPIVKGVIIGILPSDLECALVRLPVKQNSSVF